MDEDKVSNAYKEIVSELLSKYKFHPSEEKNCNKKPENRTKKSEIIFNNYHFYCLSCKNHYYTQSKANDINSFFQSHINSSHHKRKLLTEGYPDNKPMITWEKWLYSGCCNLCDMKDIEAYFINTKFHSSVLVNQHKCEKFVRMDNQFFDVCVLDKLKYFFASKVFSNKFLMERNEFVECGICNIKFIGDIKTSRYHLYDVRHFVNLISFIREKFGFSTFQILSAFNLEKIVKWLLDVDVVEKCNDPVLVDESNCTVKDKNDFEGFSPREMKSVVKMISDSIISDNICSICDKPVFEEFHFFIHWKAVKDLSLKINSQVNFLCSKTQLEMYMTLVNNLMRGGLYIGAPYKPEFDTVSLNYISTMRDQIVTIKNDNVHLLLKKKIQSLEGLVSQMGSRRTIFCEICEAEIPFNTVVDHNLGTRHQKNCQDFRRFLLHLATPDFLEPIQTLSNVMCCLICGELLQTETLFAHMQLLTHKINYKKYIYIQKIRPVSESFFISTKSCHCIHCGDLILFSNFSSLVKQISEHWPFCGLDFQKAITHTTLLFNDKKVSSFDEGVSETHSNSDEIDFESIEKNVEKLFSLWEKDVAEKVKQKVRFILPKSNFERKMNPRKGSKPDGDVKIPKEPENLKVVKEETFTNNRYVVKKEETFMNDSYVVNNDNDEGLESDKEENKVEDDQDDDEQDYEEDIGAEMEKQTKKNQQKTTLLEREPENEDREFEAVEILLEGRPSKRVCQAIAKKFALASFYFQEDNKLVFGFEKQGLAEAIVSSNTLVVNKKPLIMVFTIRNFAENPKERKNNLSREMIFFLEKPTELVKKMESLVFECLQSNYVEEKLREISVSNVIQQHLAQRYPLTKVYIFGSRMTGLSSSNSDIDIFLDYGTNFFGFDSTQAINLVGFLGNCLKKDKGCSRVTMKTKARVPIVSFFHKQSQLMCDVSFKNALSVYKTKLIQFFLTLDYRVKPLLLFVKYWTKSNNLHGSPNFTSYGISLLLVFYLQQLSSPILPSVEVLEKNFPGCRKTIDGWDYEFSTDEALLPPRNNKSSLVELLLGFFEYYASFDYQKYVICPLTGTSIKKSAFYSSSAAVAELPDILLKNIVSLPCDFKSWVNHDFCVMDPLELNHIVTKSIKNHNLNIFKLLCEKSVLYLKKGLNICQ